MSQLRDLVLGGGAELSDPGGGRTPERLAWLFDVTRRHDISTARLAEAHVDAVSILREAGREPVSGRVYGVWASSSANEPTIIDGRLTGTKRFCSGVGVIDRALVTVDVPGSRMAASGALLVDVDVRGVVHAPTTWSSPALADTATGDADFDQPIGTVDVVETARWYLDRPGFWHGACGPAACWAGGAVGLIDAALRLVDDDPHRLAHTGALVAARWSLEAIVHRAGEEIDLDPTDRRSAEIRARSLRHVVERTSSDVADRFSRAFGPRPFVSDAAVAQRFADLHLYMRQHHAERELGEITRLATAHSARDSTDV